MALTTVNQKLAIMEWCQPWEPGLPISPGTIEQDDQQQLLNDNPAPLWGELVVTPGGNVGAEWKKRRSTYPNP